MSISIIISIESSRRDFFIDMAVDRFIFKNNQITLFISKTEISFHWFSKQRPIMELYLVAQRLGLVGFSEVKKGKLGLLAKLKDLVTRAGHKRLLELRVWWYG